MISSRLRPAVAIVVPRHEAQPAEKAKLKYVLLTRTARRGLVPSPLFGTARERDMRTGFGTAGAIIALMAGASPVPAQAQAQAASAVADPSQWPALRMKLQRDPKVEARVDALLAKMS